MGMYHIAYFLYWVSLFKKPLGGYYGSFDTENTSWAPHDQSEA